jgi:SAM-dependent methyltransferase
MDATRDYFRPNVVDLAIGAAILHHLPDPQKAIAAVHHALKDGGMFVLFEPFENGVTFLRLAYSEILRNVHDGRVVEPSVAAFLQGLVTQYTIQATGTLDAKMELDDKWVFSRAFFEDVAQRVGFRTVLIYPHHDTERPFSALTEVNLRLGLGAGRDALPDWGWSILERYERGLSSHVKRDYLIEGTIVLTK